MPERAPSPLPSTNTPEHRIEDVLGSLRSDDAWERQEAAFACTQLGREADLGADIREELEDRARNDPEPKVRQFATEALGHVEEAQSVIAHALDDEDPWVRAEAAFAMAAQDPPDWEAVRSCLEDENGWVRRNTVRVLGENGELDPEEILALARGDDHPPVRETAVEMAPQLEAPEDTVVAVLADLLAWDGDAIARAKAAHALGEIGSDPAIQALKDHGLDDPSDQVRRATKVAKARALGRDPVSAQPVNVVDPANQATQPGDPDTGSSPCGACSIKPDGPGNPKPPIDP